MHPLKTAGILGSVAALTVVGWAMKPAAPAIEGPAVIHIPTGQISYRPAGDFRSGNRIVDAPPQDQTTVPAFDIMKFHVSQQDYARCVDAGLCDQVQSAAATDAFAQVNVSYLDAQNYANWLSDQTGDTWRLPTDQEWVRAAGDRFSETLLGAISNDPDPSKRWLLKYKEEAEKRGASDPELRPIGAFGSNDLDVVDINGNIWEWTTTCFKNGKVSADGSTLLSHTDYCGVRAAQGKHRAFIIDFVRDAKAGGCAVGIPPDNLGIRLVREVN